MLDVQPVDCNPWNMIEFPDPGKADANGLLAAGGNLAPETLIAAYRKSIFPWYEAGGPILWWSPDPRMVLFPDDFYCSRRLARRMRKKSFRVSENEAFTEVITACTNRQEGTWITPEMIAAYTRLFELGHAQSIEIWNSEELVGGLYGVCLKRVFFAESMFHRRTDASKIALAHLASLGQEKGWFFIDCQFHTAHLASLGARTIPRREFLHLLERALS